MSASAMARRAPVRPMGRRRDAVVPLFAVHAVMWCVLGAAVADAHIVAPDTLFLRAGGRGDFVVRDLGSCPADITVTSPDPSRVTVCPVDSLTGSPAPGCDGTTATVDDQVAQYFRVTADPGITEEATVTLEVCWIGRDFPGGPCSENNCGFPHPVTVIVQPGPRTEGGNLFGGTNLDPISTGSGGLYLPAETLLDLRGPLPVFLAVYYSSQLQSDGNGSGRLGPNWRHNYDWRLARLGSNVEVVSPAGRVIRFEKLVPATEWTLAPFEEIRFQLKEDAAGYRLADPRDQRVRRFDLDGQLTAIEDGRGNALALTHAGGRLTQVSDGLGRSLGFAYDAAGRLANVSDGTRTAAFAYDGAGQLATITNPLGGVTTLTYDASQPGAGLLTGRTLPRGNTPFTQAYGAGERVASQSDAFGNTWTLAYDDALGRTTITDPLGNDVVHTHSPDLDLVEVQDEAGLSTLMGYNARRQRDRVTDRLGGVTTWTHDAASGLPDTVTSADGTVTGFGYTARVSNGLTFHDLTSVIRPDGTTESFTYDAVGNLLSRTDPAGQVSSFTYNGRGQVLTATNPVGGVATFQYNADGTLASFTDPSGNTTTYGYDALRRPVLVTWPDGATRGFAYDDLDRLTAVTDELGNVTGYAYDPNGNLVSLTTALGNTWSFAYDAMDRLVAATDPLGGVATADYDALGRIQALTDANGTTATVAYDARGRIVAVTDAGANAWTRGYDAEAVLTSSTTPLAAATTFTSDAMGRLTGSTSPLGGTSALVYDALGRVVRTTDALGRSAGFTREARGLVTRFALPGIEAQYAYDGLGRVTQVIDPRGNAWQRGYDAQGRLVSRTDPLGRVAGVQYDVRSRPAQASLPGGLGTVSFTYDVVGRVTRALYSDGTDLSWTYDADGRLVGASDAGTGPAPGPPVASAFGYDARGALVADGGITATYDAGRRLTSLTPAPGKTVSYAYDARDHLISVTDWVGGATSFSYDAAGRLTQISRPNGVVTAYSYDADDRLIGIQHGAVGQIAVTRDAAGQVTSSTRALPLLAAPDPGSFVVSFDAADQVASQAHDPAGRVLDDGIRTYDWDLASRLRTLEDGSGSTTYAYDALGHVVSRASGTEVRRFVWNRILGLPSISIVRDSLDAALHHFVHTPAGLLLHRVEASGARRFYHEDEMGSIVFLTDDAGAVTDAWAYAPYGEVIARTGTTETRFTFHGRLGVLDEGALYRARARLYDPALGRFLTPDPIGAIGPQSVNPYLAFLDNPLFFVDPMGTDPEPGSGKADDRGVLRRLLDWFRGLWGSSEDEPPPRTEEEKQRNDYARVVERLQQQNERNTGAAEAQRQLPRPEPPPVYEPQCPPGQCDVAPGSGEQCSVCGTFWTHMDTGPFPQGTPVLPDAGGPAGAPGHPSVDGERFLGDSKGSPDPSAERSSPWITDPAPSSWFWDVTARDPQLGAGPGRPRSVPSGSLDDPLRLPPPIWTENSVGGLGGHIVPQDPRGSVPMNAREAPGKFDPWQIYLDRDRLIERDDVKRGLYIFRFRP